MPDAFGAGEFRATMNIFTDSTYRNAYIDPPILNPDEIIYVGESKLNDSNLFCLHLQQRRVNILRGTFTSCRKIY